MLEMIKALIAGKLPAPPISKTLGFRALEAQAGTAVFVMDADPEKHANPMGTLHGGVLCDLGDAAMGIAMATTLAEGESFTTVELQAHYFKPVWKQQLRATAKMVRRSQSLGYLECDIIDEKGHLVCRLGSTCMVLRGEAAKGR
jgi:uncharacterized protein (TIGR00369 family)